MRHGFSLLEIIISLVILGGAVAILGELSRSGLNNALATRNLTQAELLCESVMARVRLGLIDLENATDEPILAEDFPDTNAANEGRSEPLWVYSIDVVTIDEDGLLEVAVTVKQNIQNVKYPTAYRLVRWMVAPELEKEDEEEEDATASETTGT
ncbi:MAG: type II secretion system GspH family protein [Planctomycetaceae bacterium]|nr:type II secretion system GspH family protein [Planctomycetaceae bacterium]